MHKPIQCKDLTLSFSHKTCFSDFSAHILFGSRIAIIGRNGEGKSSLLKILQGSGSNFEGDLTLPADLRIGYLPQLIDTFETLSGGERLNRALTDALCQSPNLLLLDEPSNHLDKANRCSLMNHLRHYSGTLIMATHDVELLNLADTIWHIKHGKVQVFHGNYADYLHTQATQTAKIENELSILKQQKKNAHFALMKEQKRSKNMRIKGEKNIAQRKWPTVRSHTKLGSAIKTSDKRLQQVNAKKQTLLDELSSFHQHELITSQFQMNSASFAKSVITVRDGAVGYTTGRKILHSINFHMPSKARAALMGNNGSGKSTFIRAILGDEEIRKTGEWTILPAENIGYLDQHYQNLSNNKTVFEMVSSLMPSASYTEVRKHLNDFLFRKNEEVETKVATLSGGEKARLSLCCIAAKPKALLILDE